MDKMPKEVPSTILMVVYRSKKLTMSELYEKTKFSTITILNHVNALIKAGILEEEREGGFPKRRLIKVSREGARIASLLNVAETSGYAVSDIIEMGSRAGRISAYQESYAALRAVGATRELLMAEQLLKGIATLSSSLSILARGMPEDIAGKAEEVRGWASRLEARYQEGQKRFSAGDANGCMSEVARALSEFNGAAQLLKDVADAIREGGMEELVTFVEFLIPKTTQKE